MVVMNPEKLKQMQQSSSQMGGKGTMRRKKKVIHKTATGDEKKLTSTLKKLAVNPIPGIEEVNMFRDDGQIIHFTNPKVQASIAANTFSITGHSEEKPMTEMLPGILNQLGYENLSKLQNFLGGERGETQAAEAEDDDDEVPDLVENFDEASKAEAV